MRLNIMLTLNKKYALIYIQFLNFIVEIIRNLINDKLNLVQILKSIFHDEIQIYLKSSLFDVHFDILSEEF